MGKWTGAAAVCINERNEILMVLQGKPEEEKMWSVPSGGREPGETYEKCCAREVWEETGYIVAVAEKLFVKGEVHYFKVHLLGGQPVIQDPDGLIYDIAWKSAEELTGLELCFPEDRQPLLRLLKQTPSEL